jgi:hypothetical protein
VIRCFWLYNSWPELSRSHYWVYSQSVLAPCPLRLTTIDFPKSESRSRLDVRPPSGTRGQFFFSFSLKLSLDDSYRFVIVWRPLWREGGSVIYSCCWASPPQSFSGPSSTGPHNQILLSQIWDSLSLESKVPLCISPRNSVALLFPQAWMIQSVAEVEVMLPPTVNRPICLGVDVHLGTMTRFLLRTDICGFLYVQHPLWRKDGSVIYFYSYF